MDTPPTRLPRIALALAVSLALVGCGRGRDHGSANPTSRQAGDPPRVLVIGLDGADWSIIDRLAAEGRVPNLARLRSEGASGVLTSEAPYISPIVWTTIATGRSPLDHGIYGFLTRRAGREETVRSDERQVHAFWNIATDEHVPVGVLGWYSTWPAEQVDGFLVSDRAGAHQVAGTAARPVEGLATPKAAEDAWREVAAEVSRTVGAADAEAYFAPVAGAPPLAKEKLDTFVDILRTTVLYERLFPRLLREFHPAIAAVYFEGTDAAGHLFVDYTSPPIEGLDPRAVARYAGAFDKYYARIDETVGRLLEGVDPARTTVMIISDHGFKTGPARPMVPTTSDAGNQAPLWHRPQGIVLLWGRGVRKGIRIPDASIYDVLPTICRLGGLPASSRLPGRPLDAALAPEALSVPLRSVADYEASAPLAHRPPPAGPAGGDEERIAQLRALGYVGADAGRASTGAAGADGQLAVPVSAYNHAVLLANARRFDEAIAAFRELQRLDPRSALGFTGEGLALLNEGRAADALVPLRRATAIDPRLPLAQAYLAEAALRAGDERAAFDAFQRSLTLDPSDGRAALMLGQILLKKRNVAQAEPLLERARRTADQPEDRAGADVRLAAIAEQRGKFGDAERFYGEALATVPDYAPALERAGNLMLYLDRAPQAIGYLEKLVGRQPGNADGLALYGIALAKVGRTAEARAALQRSLAIAPGQAEARAALAALR